jgi:hypothetical protein
MPMPMFKAESRKLRRTAKTSFANSCMRSVFIRASGPSTLRAPMARLSAKWDTGGRRFGPLKSLLFFALCRGTVDLSVQPS